MSGVQAVENFYGVYLLYCKNPDYAGRTYIGYTVDPNRRIKQHNRGKAAGGAWKTSKKGPWSMVLIVHGFPNDITALRFEWAWQHPQTSRRLKHVPRKKSKERVYEYCLRVLSEMLKVGPWNRLPLTIRWLDEEFIREFPPNKSPPMHMPICVGQVVSKKLPKESNPMDSSTPDDALCTICSKAIDGKRMHCLNPSCDLVSHVICLSRSFLSKGEYVPVEGKCPGCHMTLLWGDIVRKYKGCYGNLNISINTKGDDFYSSDSD